jgi:hypothetical protein
VDPVKAVVVCESLWGNTATIADADLIVAGAPVLGFKLSSEKLRESVRANPGKAPTPPDLSHPAVRTWLDALPGGQGASAAFHTGVRGPLGSAAPAIAEPLEEAGYASVAKPVDFVVSRRFGPLRDGELERARAWGAELAKALA